MSPRAPYLRLAAAIALLALPVQGLASVRLARVGTFDQPVFVTAPAGDVHHVFVVERTGTIRIVVDGRVADRPFLDLRRQVSRPTGPSDERGRLSMAFSPDDARSGRLYVSHTIRRARPAGTSDVVVDEYRAASADALRVDPAYGLRNLAPARVGLDWFEHIRRGFPTFAWEPANRPHLPNGSAGIDRDRSPLRRFRCAQVP